VDFPWAVKQASSEGRSTKGLCAIRDSNPEPADYESARGGSRLVHHGASSQVSGLRRLRRTRVDPYGFRPLVTALAPKTLPNTHTVPIVRTFCGLTGRSAKTRSLDLSAVTSPPAQFHRQEASVRWGRFYAERLAARPSPSPTGTSQAGGGA